MHTVLNTADYGPSSREIELSDSRISHKAFWATLFEFAAEEQACMLIYDLDYGDDCLGVWVDTHKHILEPPPLEYRSDLLAAGRRLVLGGKLKMAFRLLFYGFDEIDRLGLLLANSPRQQTKWHAYSLPNAIWFSRFQWPDV